MLANLFPVLSTVVSTYTPMTSLQVFEAATTPRSPNNALGSSVWASQNSLNDVAVRIAHIGVLHWRVWAPLAYLVNPDGEGDVDVNAVLSDEGSDRSQGNSAANPEVQDSTSDQPKNS